MVIYFGADHRGFRLKEAYRQFAVEQGYEVVDLGAKEYAEDDDYVDFAAAVAKKVSMDPNNSRGILICGSGAGVDIVANKFRHIRSVLAGSVDQVYDARHDDDVNVLSLAANFLSEDEGKKMMHTFLQTPFSKEERYTRRLLKIGNIEDSAPLDAV